MTPANRADAEIELKEVIRQSVNDNTMWTKDWSKEQLTRFVTCLPRAVVLTARFDYSLQPRTFKRKM